MKAGRAKMIQTFPKIHSILFFNMQLEKT